MSTFGDNQREILVSEEMTVRLELFSPPIDNGTKVNISLSYVESCHRLVVTQIINI
jgi:hypothetical protein